jgi:uncharacterized protein
VKVERAVLATWGGRLGWAAAARPRVALGWVLAAVMAMAPGLLRLELRTDGRSLVPPDDPAVAADRAARELFGLRDPLLVVLETEHPDGIFNPATLDRLERLTRDLSALPGVPPEQVVSLATEHGMRFVPGSPDFRRLLDPPPATPERLAELRDEVEAIDILHGTLVSYDRRATAVLLGVPGPADGPEGEALDRAALVHRVAEVARRHEAGGDRLSVVGAPAAEALLGEHVLADLALLIPLSLAVIAGVLWIACGRAWAALLGLAKVGAAQVFTLGLIGWCGAPVYLTTAVIPVLLTTIGLADEIHLLWRWRHRPEGEAPAEAIRRTVAELARPITLTSLTTSIGFLSFLGSSIPAVRSFGLFTAAGVLFCMAWALVATPALLALRPGAIPAASPSGRAPAGTFRLARLALALGGRPRFALPVLAVATGLLALGIPRLTVQDGWIHNFAPESPLRQATERVDRRFAGTHVLTAVLTFDPPPEEVPAIPVASGPLLAGSTVAAVGRFEQALRARPDVGGVFGLSSHLETTAYLWSGRLESQRAILDDPAWIYLHARRIGNVRGEARRRELVDDAFRSTAVTLLLKGANYRQTAGIVTAIRELERSELAPVHGRVELAGDVAVSQAMIPAIVRTQVGSLLLALAGTLAVASLLLGSLRHGLACVAPAAVAVAWTFGLMGWSGMPLGVATSMFCAVTLGIGVDYGVHFHERLRAARAAGAARPVREASAAAGPAILIDAVAIALGFGLMAFSQVPTNRRLGLLVALGLTSACLLTLSGAAGALERFGSRRSRPADEPSIPGSALAEEAP